MTRVLFRCDGDTSVGLGHVSRCAGLAEAFDEIGIRATFYGQYNAAALCLLESCGADVARSHVHIAGSMDDADETLRLAATLDAFGIVLDGYGFGEAFLEAHAEGRTGRRLMIIDDFADHDRYPRGARILNSTLQAQGMTYRGDELSVFAGPEYLLVRRALRALRATPQPPSGRSTVRCLVALGGVDRFGRTLSVVDALAALSTPPDVDVVLSESAPVHGRVAERLARWPSGGRLFGRLPNLADRFADSDACITAGGLTMYEACFLGRPVAVCPQSVREAEDAAFAARAGVALDLSAALEAGREALTEALARFVTPRSLHALRRALAGRFPTDPTRTAARALTDR
jgi:spore coat polysaccharide biosynthesis predicted glycosyltransferase SpsG